MTSALFGSSPKVVQSGPQPTTNTTQGSIQQLLSNLLTSGASAPGATTVVPNSGASAYAAPLTQGQNNIVDALQNLVAPTTAAAGQTSGASGGVLQALQKALQYQAPQVAAPTATGTQAATVNPAAATQAFQQGVVTPTTQNFLQTVLPAIKGAAAGSAGGAYSTGGAEATNQAVTNLNNTLAGQGAQYALNTQTANQSAETANNQLLTQIALGNLSGALGTNQLNVGAGLAGEGVNEGAINAAPTAISSAFAPSADTASILSSIFPTVSAPQTTAQTGITGQIAADTTAEQQNLNLLQLMSQFSTTPTQQNTTVAQSGSSGLIPSLLSSVASNSGFGNQLGTALFSDERLKTDVKRIGKLPRTKLPLYSFRYKSDPGNVRRIGVMAQDAEKKLPAAVGQRDGFKTVNYATVALEEAFGKAA